MIVGVGVDVCPVERFAESLRRTPRLKDKLFTSGELLTPAGNERQPASLAARFAAKEALAKALGAPGNLQWHDAEIEVADRGRPRLVTRGSVRERADQLGVRGWQISLSHDGGIAVAMVVALSMEVPAL